MSRAEERDETASNGPGVRRPIGRAIGFAISFAFLTGACHRETRQPEVEVTTAAGAPTLSAGGDVESVISPYPAAPWRQTDKSELDCIVIFTSHILIRFDGGMSSSVNFDLARWRSVAPPATRTRAQAIELATHLASTARHEPERFAELAIEYSEDLTTRDRGGSLGGITASQFRMWPRVLDALAAIRPGEVSRVVETPNGFHVFKRFAPPKPATASGSHIVIAHDDAPWLRVVARGEVPRRRRDDAQVLARQVYDLARQHPERFEELVLLYSEHRDAARGGDFGSWSSRAPGPFPREVEVLHSLAVGELAPPLDTRVGFQIIRRVPDRRRPRYSMTAIQLEYDANEVDGHPSSRARVADEAHRMARQVMQSPEQFAELQARHCCTRLVRWEDGRGSPSLTAVLERLKPGEVAKEAVESDGAFVIAKRLELPWPEMRVVRHDLSSESSATTSAADVTEEATACAPNQAWSVKLDESGAEAGSKGIAAPSAPAASPGATKKLTAATLR
jgi:hypothetical protein